MCSNLKWVSLCSLGFELLLSLAIFGHPTAAIEVNVNRLKDEVKTGLSLSALGCSSLLLGLDCHM
jgi:hypothetical protein